MADKKVERVVPRYYPVDDKDIEPPPSIKYTKVKLEETGLATPGDSIALSSHIGTRYDLIPAVFLERVAKRFEEGTKKYPAFNYAQGLADKKYIIDRINHLQAHLTAFLWPQSDDEWEDDNLAAIGWAVAFLMLCDRKVIAQIRAERETVQQYVKGTKA